MRFSTSGALALTALVLAGTLPASATIFCGIRTTRDGYAALRARPDPEAALLARMVPGDEVLIGLGKRGKWIEVTHWRGDERLSRKSKGRKGWMHGALTDEVCG